MWHMTRANKPSGPRQRQLRVGELIRRTLSEVLARGEVHDRDLQRLSITVGEVVTSTDLNYATIYILPLGGSQEDRELALAALRRNKGELRHLISRSMIIKHVPDLRFAIDQTYDRLDETRRLFANEQVRRDIAKRDTPEDAPAADTAEESDPQA